MNTSFLFSHACPVSETNAGLDDQGIGVGLKTQGVHLRVEAVRVGAAPIAVHEMTLHLHIPEFIYIEPRRDDFVVNVIGGQTRVGFVRGNGRKGASKDTGDRVAGVIGAKGQPLRNPVGSGGVPAAYIGYILEGEGLDDLIAQIAAILRIDPQFPQGVLALELVGPVRLRTLGVRNQSGAGVDGIAECPFAVYVLIHSGRSDQQPPQGSIPAEVGAIL